MLDFGWEAYALLGAGLLFVVLEMLFPSGGLLGLGAAICLALGSAGATVVAAARTKRDGGEMSPGSPKKAVPTPKDRASWSPKRRGAAVRGSRPAASAWPLTTA